MRQVDRPTILTIFLTDAERKFGVLLSGRNYALYFGAINFNSRLREQTTFMDSFLGRYSEYAYAIFRFVIGFLFLFHGTQKLFAFPPSDRPGELSTFIMIGAIIELVGGVMVMLGFFGAIAAFICSGTMAVAYFMFHQPGGFLPIVNKGELAVVYCFAFLLIAAKGSGLWSLDSLLRGSSATATGS